MNLRITAFVLVLSSAVVSASAVQLVTNGDFEATPLGSGFTIASSGGYDATDIFGDYSSLGVPLNTVSAYLGGYNNGTDSLTQSINTTGAYSNVLLTMDVVSDGDDDANIPAYDYLSISFGGTEIARYDAGTPTGNYDEFFAIPVSLNLKPYFTGGFKDLTISVHDDSSFPTSVFVDNVSITATPVPEPASFAALGLGALAFVRRRRLKS